MQAVDYAGQLSHATECRRPLNLLQALTVHHCAARILLVSAIEDVRQVVQDFLAPELRAIAVQIESLNKRMDNLEANIGIQFAAARTEASSRQEVVLLQIEHFRSLLDVYKLLLRLENQRADPLSKIA